MTPRIKNSIKYAIFCLLPFVIIYMIATGITYWLENHLNQRRTDFEKIVSDKLQLPVTMGAVRIRWHRLEPEINFQTVTILSDKTHKPIFNIDHIEIDLAFWQSLFHWQPFTQNFVISGAKLTLRQESDKTINVNEFDTFTLSDNFTGESVEGNRVLEWILLQPNLGLENIDVTFIQKNKIERAITLANMSLKNSGDQHTFAGAAILQQAIPTKVNVTIHVKGDVKKLNELDAQVYLHVEGFSLAQWLTKQTWNRMQVKGGIGSAKIWAHWENNQWQSVNTQFVLYDFEWTSLITQKTQYLQRASGSIRWEHEARRDIISGEDLLLDFSDHLWQTTRFKMVFAPAADNAWTLQQLQTGYIDLFEMKQIALDSGFLPDRFRNPLIALAPTGEIESSQFTLKMPLKNLSSIAGQIAFKEITVNAWEQLPAIKNLSGIIQWENERGTLKLQSNRTEITFDKVFSDPLFLENLSGDIAWQKNKDATWTVNAKEVRAKNSEMSAITDMTLHIPVKGSPKITLSANFTANAANVVHYLPMKTFDPSLVTWLNEAFLSGTVNNGKAILQGTLSDFPFDNNSGKFEIRGDIAGLNFHYAPDWPLIQNAKGELLFSNRSMTVDITSGKIGGATLAKIHGVIPDLGAENKQVVNVGGLIIGDFADGLQFIRQSPLNKTIGKELTALHLAGDMQLQLNLSIPIHQTENTTVKGSAPLHNAVLALPEWKLTLDRLNGTFQFSENTLQSSGLKARVFNENISLQMATVRDAKNISYVKAQLQGMLSMAALEDWLQLSFANHVSGKTNYTAELHLYSIDKHQPTDVIFNSDLKGLTIDLPMSYSKPADAILSSQLEMLIDSQGPIRAKLNYGNKLSFAGLLQKTNGKFSLIGGELSLSGEANWPKDPGILITGRLNELDWDKARDYLPSSDTPSEFFVRGIDLQVGTLSAWGQQLQNVRVQASRDQQGFKVGLDNAKFSGELTLPHNPAQPISARFKRFYLETVSSLEQKTALNLKSFPAISFVGDDVKLGNKKLGHVELDVTPVLNGLTIKSLLIRSPLLEMNARGDWVQRGDNARSHMVGTARSSNMSNLLNEWGLHINNLIASEADATFNLTWSDVPYRPSLKTISGNVGLNLGKGRILTGTDSAELGIGRLLNVFSLQTLPRRLSLDFSDLFEKGYSFDYMKGDFILKNGNAETQRTVINGPVARVDIEGRIGLIAKNFDMTLRVTPYVTSSIPVVAAYFYPPAGIAAWLAERVLGRAVSKAVTYHYTVTGSWDNPVWQQAQ